MKKIDFNKLKGETPDIDSYIKKVNDLITKVKESKSEAEALDLQYEYFKVCDDFNSDSSIVYIHFTQDTTNEEYAKAMEELDARSPEFTDACIDFEKATLESEYLPYLEEKLGKLYFDISRSDMKIFSKEIMEDIVEENKLTYEYNKLVSSAQIEFNGEVLNLSQISKYTKDKDRNVRKEAAKKVSEFYATNDKALGDIYDKLVKVRTKMAKKLGFENYLGLGYLRMGRLDWDKNDVKKYREQIVKHIVPLANKYRKLQVQRIGIEDPKYYDYQVNFNDGNPEPFGTTKEKIENAQKMYDEMEKEIGSYFRVLKESNLLDLEARKGKSGGGYESYIPSLKAPFIFSNFNGSSADVDVLTHEFGHALQAFLGAKYDNPSYRSPGLECCEMHSMSMEYLTYPYLNYFFDEKNLKKYHFQHIIDAIFFIPYGACVDEFQEKVYENPAMTPEERKRCWRELEHKYLPHINYGTDDEFLESGGYWYRQRHIFESPLYYIDYTIAQVVSLEFLVRSHLDMRKALDQYLFFCSLGGTLPYHQLLKTAGIDDPMEEGVILNLIPEVEKLIEHYKNILETK